MLWALSYGPGNIILFLACVAFIWLSFYDENLFIKGKMKLRIISEVMD